jgi:hypothetical protein
MHINSLILEQKLTLMQILSMHPKNHVHLTKYKLLASPNPHVKRSSGASLEG